MGSVVVKYLKRLPYPCGRCMCCCMWLAQASPTFLFDPSSNMWTTPTNADRSHHPSPRLMGCFPKPAGSGFNDRGRITTPLFINKVSALVLLASGNFNDPRLIASPRTHSHRVGLPTPTYCSDVHRSLICDNGPANLKPLPQGKQTMENVQLRF